MSETTPEKKSKLETLKESSRQLRGSLPETLAAPVSHFAPDETQLLKFHGMYQQDDRDTRPVRLKEQKEKDFSLMVRTKTPGGAMTADQYLVYDRISSEFGNGTLRITTRQGFQFHGVLKKNVKSVIQKINKALGTTSGACGDIVRNVMCSPAPYKNKYHAELLDYAKKLSDQFLSRSGAYQEIWLDGERVSHMPEPTSDGSEPIFGKTYLPRKFKIGLAFPDDNHVDVYTNDLGIVPELNAAGSLIGFNILVGGGLGMTHGLERTYPRLATPLCFVKPEDLLEVCKAIVLVQRDHGNRADRKLARMKYLIDDRGIDWFREEVEKRFGRPVQLPKEIKIAGIETHTGWHAQGDGKWFLGVSIENGRIKDEGSLKLKSGLRAIIEKYKPQIFLTAQQDIILAELEESARADIDAMLAQYGIPNPDTLSLAQKNAMACPALPTCGLAISESERVFPSVIDDLEKLMKDLGLENQQLITRMTGCPNGCARPYNAEIAFVGRAAGSYNIYVGGNLKGNRLNALLVEKVTAPDLIPVLRPVFENYKKERQVNEGFGDFCNRRGMESIRALLPKIG